jgi:eukaryotic-like serine/threonine-protein kinase
VRPSRAAEIAAGGRVGDFVLVERIGRGGFGEVWLARHELSAQDAAIKFPRDRDVLDALRREDALAATLSHPLIVEVLASGLLEDPPWVAFRYIRGESLREAILRGPLPTDAALGVYGDVLSALAHAHGQSVVHGDVKPENIILDGEGRAHLTDFGLGRIVGEVAGAAVAAGRRETAEGLSISGTVEYMAPEQRRGEDGSARSDLYTLAVVLFEMLTGALPEGAESPSDLRPGLDPRVDALFFSGHARHGHRYTSAGEALADLDEVLASRETSARTCESCGWKADADEYFCIRCGHQLRANLDRCACGFLPEVGDRHCIRCGGEAHAGHMV